MNAHVASRMLSHGDEPAGFVQPLASAAAGTAKPTRMQAVRTSILDVRDREPSSLGRPWATTRAPGFMEDGNQ
ncbi:MAG: hypothetical protein MJD61_04085 [Proteobacteria bacterium]|nr:hypothetical protein [Pseudomonadota bacterium]